MTELADVAFVPLILPLAGSDPNERPDGLKPGPLAAMLHKSPKLTRRLLLYVPGMIEGMFTTGRHDYPKLGRALDTVDCSLMLVQMSTAQRTEYVPFDTCANDIHTAVEWAKTQGFTEIALTGISIGGTRVAFWNAMHPDPVVKTLIFIATIESICLSQARNWKPEQEARYWAVLDECRAAIAAGEPNRIVIGDMLGSDLPLSARVYLSFFGKLDEMNCSTVKFTDKITVPAAMIHSTRDFIAPPEGAKAIYESLVNAPRRSMTWVENGDHQLLTKDRVGDDTTRAIVKWVDSTLAR